MPVSDSADCFNKLVDCERREIIQSRYNLNHALYTYKLGWMLWMVVPVDWQNNHLLMWYWSEEILIELAEPALCFLCDDNDHV